MFKQQLHMYIAVKGKKVENLVRDLKEGIFQKYRIEKEEYWEWKVGSLFTANSKARNYKFQKTIQKLCTG